MTILPAGVRKTKAGMGKLFRRAKARGRWKMAQAAATGFWSKIQDLIFPHLFSDLTVAGIIYWLTGKQKEGTAKDAPYIDVRGELLADMLPRSAYPNLWRRHGEASVAKTENRFVKLLAKVPKRPVDLRKTVFPGLEAMSDAEFNQALEELHHDMIWQFLERVALHGGPVFKAAWEFVKKLGGKIYTYAQDLDAWLDQRAKVISGTGPAPSPYTHPIPVKKGHPILKIVLYGFLLPGGVLTMIGWLLLRTAR